MLFYNNRFLGLVQPSLANKLLDWVFVQDKPIWSRQAMNQNITYFHYSLDSEWHLVCPD